MGGGNWLESAGCVFLRLSLAIVFVWFGLLKLFDLCPLGEFICRTLPFLPPAVFLFTLGCWEVAIGLCLLVPRLVRLGLYLLLLHLPGTMLPLLLLPEECFTRFPLGLTLAGQYIVKNLILASAPLVIAGSCRRALPPPMAADRAGTPLSPALPESAANGRWQGAAPRRLIAGALIAAIAGGLSAHGGEPANDFLKK